MTYTDFTKACESGAFPEGGSELLRSLYEDRRGDWDTAHTIAQRILTPEGSLVHAYLHREEGDIGNANYWYAKARASAPETSLEEEWDTLARRYTDG
jgi:hypothetical protein